MRRYRPVAAPGLPRFVGGAVGYIAYDMIRYFEKLPDDTVDELACYDSHFIITDSIMVFDNLKHTISVVVNSLTGEEPLEDSYRKAVDKVEALIGKLSAL